jgi:hypothetical protein
MKEGLIVYLVGGQEIPEPFDLNRNCRQLGLPAHQVELVGRSQGFFSVDDAWHFLLTRGFGKVSLLVAQWQQEALQPVYPPLRLCG